MYREITLDGKGRSGHRERPSPTAAPTSKRRQRALGTRPPPRPNRRPCSPGTTGPGKPFQLAPETRAAAGPRLSPAGLGVPCAAHRPRMSRLVHPKMRKYACAYIYIYQRIHPSIYLSIDLSLFIYLSIHSCFCSIVYLFMNLLCFCFSS